MSIAKTRKFAAMKRSTDKERAEFADRLRQAYGMTEHPDYGKYSFLAAQFGLTPAAVKKWFTGDVIPTSRINAIADFLRVRAEWLLSNRGPMKSVEATGSEGEALKVELHHVPLVEPENYNEWVKGMFPVSSYVIAAGKLSSHAFAFELRDNSALPIAMRGLIAVVDPDDPDARHPTAARKLVVVYDEGSYLVGRYIQRGYATIEPENKDYKPVQLTENHQVVGVLSMLAQRDL